jgi:RNA polymerase sigma-70 factor (ECF subfamily)
VRPDGEKFSMPISDSEWERIPARFQGYLMAIARVHLNPALRGKVGPESVVQETLLEAFRDRASFRGRSDPELAAFLRAILVRNIRDAVRGLGRAKRDAHLEVSLAALDRASAQLDRQLTSSPERKVQRIEDLLRFIDALGRLPEDERDVLELRHLQGLSLKEVAELLGRRHDAVRRLASQGERRLRALFEEPG